MNPLTTLLIHIHSWYTHHEYTVWTIIGGTLGGTAISFHLPNAQFYITAAKVAIFAAISATVSYLVKWGLDVVTKNQGK